MCKRFVALILCVLSMGCTYVKIEREAPDGSIIRGSYLQVFQNKSLKLGEKELEYNVSNDPTIQLFDKIYQLGRESATVPTAK